MQCLVEGAVNAVRATSGQVERLDEVRSIGDLDLEVEVSRVALALTVLWDINRIEADREDLRSLDRIACGQRESENG